MKAESTIKNKGKIYNSIFLVKKKLLNVEIKIKFFCFLSASRDFRLRDKAISKKIRYVVMLLSHSG